MSSTKNTIKKGSEYSRIYERLAGIDPLTESDGASHFHILKNMYVDYEGGGDSVESIPGFRKLLSLGGRINGIYLQKQAKDGEHLIVHAGQYICRLKRSELENYSDSNIYAVAIVEDTKSVAFSFGGSLYVMDGKTIVRITENGFCANLGSAGARAYVPILYKNAHRFEKRNLLTNIAKEIFDIQDPDLFVYSSPGLKFAITDEINRFCAVVGAPGIKGEVYIPALTKIGETYYRVTEISVGAFEGNDKIIALFTSPNLKIIDKYAFYNCVGLKNVFISNTVSSIGEGAFEGCSQLTELHFNSFPIEDLGARSFYSCSALSSVGCVGDISSFKNVTSGSGLEDKTASSVPVDNTVTLSFRLCGQVSSVNKVLVNEDQAEFSYNEGLKTILVNTDDLAPLIGGRVSIEYILKIEDEISDHTDGDFLTTEGGRRVGGVGAILGCKISESFDGRIFLSGNPELPGVVFYSEIDKNLDSQPLYFSSANFFVDGVGGHAVTDLLSTGGSLAVFKAEDDGSGTIFYHERKEKDNEIIYPVSYVHGSVPVIGGATNFFDEPIFLTDRGVCALEKSSFNSYKEIRCRSEGISALLKKEDLSAASLTEWLGYLVVCVGANIYLADSRSFYKRNGILQYDWYWLTDIGTYTNAARVYRYSDEKIEGYINSDNPEEEALGIVFSELCNGKTVYYVKENEKKVLVYETDELEGGIFDPACCVLGDGKNLFFGTLGGDICVFNNDKRGIPPTYLSDSEYFNEEEYQKKMEGRIHPYFYTFADHRISCGALTVWDDCDTPFYTKSTIRGSLSVKLKTFEDSKITVYVETDSDGQKKLAEIPISRFSFEDVDFTTMTFSPSGSVTVSIPESEKGWTEKRLLLQSDTFRAPFGIYSLGYRYKLRGRIK